MKEFFIDALITVLPILIATEPLNTAQYIADLEAMIKPVIVTATQWAFKVALGILGGQAFYALVIRVTKI